MNPYNRLPSIFNPMNPLKGSTNSSPSGGSPDIVTGKAPVKSSKPHQSNSKRNDLEHSEPSIQSGRGDEVSPIIIDNNPVVRSRNSGEEEEEWTPKRPVPLNNRKRRMPTRSIHHQQDKSTINSKGDDASSGPLSITISTTPVVSSGIRRERPTRVQRSKLNAYYIKNCDPTIGTYKVIARKVGLSEKYVIEWFRGARRGDREKMGIKNIRENRERNGSQDSDDLIIISRNSFVHQAPLANTDLMSQNKVQLTNAADTSSLKVRPIDKSIEALSSPSSQVQMNREQKLLNETTEKVIPVVSMAEPAPVSVNIMQTGQSSKRMTESSKEPAARSPMGSEIDLSMDPGPQTQSEQHKQMQLNNCQRSLGADKSAGNSDAQKMKQFQISLQKQQELLKQQEFQRQQEFLKQQEQQAQDLQNHQKSQRNQEHQMASLKEQVIQLGDKQKTFQEQRLGLQRELHKMYETKNLEDLDRHNLGISGVTLAQSQPPGMVSATSYSTIQSNNQHILQTKPVLAKQAQAVTTTVSNNDNDNGLQYADGNTVSESFLRWQHFLKHESLICPSPSSEQKKKIAVNLQIPESFVELWFKSKIFNNALNNQNPIFSKFQLYILYGYVSANGTPDPLKYEEIKRISGVSMEAIAQYYSILYSSKSSKDNQISQNDISLTEPFDGTVSDAQASILDNYCQRFFKFNQYQILKISHDARIDSILVKHWIGLVQNSPDFKQMKLSLWDASILSNHAFNFLNELSSADERGLLPFSKKDATIIRKSIGNFNISCEDLSRQTHLPVSVLRKWMVGQGYLLRLFTDKKPRVNNVSPRTNVQLSITIPAIFIAIGSWKRSFSYGTTENSTCRIWFANDMIVNTFYISGYGYKICYRITDVSSFELLSLPNSGNQVEFPGEILIKLKSKPTFYFRRPGSTLDWNTCDDFTESQQASRIFIHHFIGIYPLLRIVASKLGRIVPNPNNPRGSFIEINSWNSTPAPSSYLSTLVPASNGPSVICQRSSSIADVPVPSFLQTRPQVSHVSLGQSPAPVLNQESVLVNNSTAFQSPTSREIEIPNGSSSQPFVEIHNVRRQIVTSPMPPASVPITSSAISSPSTTPSSELIGSSSVTTSKPEVTGDKFITPLVHSGTTISPTDSVLASSIANMGNIGKNQTNPEISVINNTTPRSNEGISVNKTTISGWSPLNLSNSSQASSQPFANQKITSAVPDPTQVNDSTLVIRAKVANEQRVASMPLNPSPIVKPPSSVSSNHDSVPSNITLTLDKQSTLASENRLKISSVDVSRKYPKILPATEKKASVFQVQSSTKTLPDTAGGDQNVTTAVPTPLSTATVRSGSQFTTISKLPSALAPVVHTAGNIMKDGQAVGSEFSIITSDLSTTEHSHTSINPVPSKITIPSSQKFTKQKSGKSGSKTNSDSVSRSPSVVSAKPSASLRNSSVGSYTSKRGSFKKKEHRTIIVIEDDGSDEDTGLNGIKKRKINVKTEAVNATHIEATTPIAKATDLPAAENIHKNTAVLSNVHVKKEALAQATPRIVSEPSVSSGNKSVTRCLPKSNVVKPSLTTTASVSESNVRMKKEAVLMAQTKSKRPSEPSVRRAVDSQLAEVVPDRRTSNSTRAVESPVISKTSTSQNSPVVSHIGLKTSPKSTNVVSNVSRQRTKTNDSYSALESNAPKRTSLQQLLSQYGKSGSGILDTRKKSNKDVPPVKTKSKAVPATNKIDSRENHISNVLNRRKPVPKTETFRAVNVGHPQNVISSTSSIGVDVSGSHVNESVKKNLPAVISEIKKGAVIPSLDYY